MSHKQKFEEYKIVHSFYYSDDPLKKWINETNFSNLFDSDWNEMMLLVDKIEALNNGGFEVGIHFGSTIIDQCRDSENGELHNPKTLFEITLSEGYCFDDKIGFTYEAAIQFIKWYTNQTVN